MSLRWTGSDRLIMSVDNIRSLAEEVAKEIREDQYDGYTCRNAMLAGWIVLHLTAFTDLEHWYIHSDLDHPDEHGPIYRVWVERQEVSK